MLGTYWGLLAVAAALAPALAAIGAGIGEGLVFFAAIQGVARQPEAEGRIRSLMILCFGLVETLFILALVVFFLLQSKLPTSDQISALLPK